MAPIQISYLGYPGTMGCDFIDYIIADNNLIPKDYQKFYSEKPIYLPNTYMPTDNTEIISSEPVSRKQLGLPEKSFVFCVINNSYKITPVEFIIWMRLLKKISGSVLWLFAANNHMKSNLIKVALSNGISSDRLVFVEYKQRKEYLEQFSCADLFLDTFIYNAGATAKDALWAGLPIVTKLGKSYTSRMAGSLLKSIGLEELVTTTENDYENLILYLAKNPTHLKKIKMKLKKNLLSKPLFNTELYTKHLENGYKLAYENFLQGYKPKVINVK